MREITELNFNGMLYAIRNDQLERISKQNLQTLIKYDLQNKREGLGNTTRANHISFLVKLSKNIPIPYEEMTRKKLNGYIDTLQLNNSSIQQYVIMIRKFFKWFYQKKNPDCIKDLKILKVKNNILKFSDMLTEEEIQKLIDAYPEPQHKALVSVLYDSACRVGELVGLNREHVKCNNGLWTISVDGKTGVRNIPLTLSTIYLEPWFNQYHPFKENKQSPLFFSVSNREKYKEPLNRRLGIPAVWSILKQGEKTSGIKKEIHPHLLRHSRLTWLADNGLSENMMRLFAGWEPGSNMPAVYLHTNPVNIATKIYQKQGSAPPEQLKPEPSKLLPKKCPRCKVENDPSSPYCKHCWLPLNIKVSMAETMMIDLFRSDLYHEESKIAQQEGRYLDMEHLAGKLQEWKQESNKPNRKQVQVVKTLP